MKPFRCWVFASIVVVSVACSNQSAPASKGSNIPAPAAQPPTSPAGVAVATRSTPGTPVPSPSPTSAIPPTVQATVAPNPLAVKLKTDDTKTVSAVITSDGGMLSAAGADGTLFTLLVPPKSLRGSTTIKMTPVTAVEGLPFSGGLLGSVQFEPDGLQFLQPATFTMELAAPIPSDAQEVVGFAAHEDGSEFHLYPWQVDGRKVTMELLHFSPRGAAKGTKDDIARQLRRVPTSSGDLFEQEMSAERMAAFKTEKSPYDLLKKWYDNSFAPEIGSPSAQLVRQFLNWYQEVKRQKLEGRFSKEIAQAVKKLRAALEEDVQHAYDVCLQGNLDGLGWLLQWMQYLDALGEIDGLYPLGFQDKLHQCATFDLTFDAQESLVMTSPAFDTSFEFTVQGVVPGVQFDIARNDFQAEGNLKLTGPTPRTNVKIPFSSCEFSGTYSANGTLKVYSPMINLSENQAGGWNYDIFVTIDPGIIRQNMLGMTCTMEHTGEWTELAEQSGSDFSAGFAHLHRKEANERGFFIMNWERGTSGVLARKIYRDSDPLSMSGVSRTFSENTTLTLVHKPRQ